MRCLFLIECWFESSREYAERIWRNGLRASLRNSWGKPLAGSSPVIRTVYEATAGLLRWVVAPVVRKEPRGFDFRRTPHAAVMGTGIPTWLKPE